MHLIFLLPLVAAVAVVFLMLTKATAKGNGDDAAMWLSPRDQQRTVALMVTRTR